MLGADLLNVVEESQTSGRLEATIISTFIALILKTDHLLTFDDFHPISLCNCLYKIIAKIIANRVKPILSKHILPEQFAFLKHRQIHEVIGTAQEVLHTLHCKRGKGMIMKVDLSKAFDRVNWLYLRMLLTHLDFPFSSIRWIMGCISNIPFSVLVNGSATPFFTLSRALRQGRPLSPLLFLLVMEGFSRITSQEHRRGRLRGIKIS